MASHWDESGAELGDLDDDDIDDAAERVIAQHDAQQSQPGPHSATLPDHNMLSAVLDDMDVQPGEEPSANQVAELRVLQAVIRVRGRRGRPRTAPLPPSALPIGLDEVGFSPWCLSLGAPRTPHAT